MYLDNVATGRNICKLMKERGITAKMLQDIFGFTTTQAIYKWFRGASMPTVDNLVILADVLGTTIDEIIVRHR